MDDKIWKSAKMVVNLVHGKPQYRTHRRHCKL